MCISLAISCFYSTVMSLFQPQAVFHIRVGKKKSVLPLKAMGAFAVGFIKCFSIITLDRDAVGNNNHPSGLCVCVDYQRLYTTPPRVMVLSSNFATRYDFRVKPLKALLLMIAKK